MAKCFDVTGYIEPCNVLRDKYTGRALLITGKDYNRSIISPTFSTNGLKVTTLYNNSSAFDNFVLEWNSKHGKALPVIIDAQNPFGVTVQGNTDSGRVMYTKTIPVSIPATRDGKAEEFVMGLQKGLYGCAAIVLETFGNSDNNDIFGAYSPLHIDVTSVTRSEYENGGAWTFNLICDEPVPNVVCTMTKLSAALDTLNA